MNYSCAVYSIFICYRKLKEIDNIFGISKCDITISIRTTTQGLYDSMVEMTFDVLRKFQKNQPLVSRVSMQSIKNILFVFM